MEIRYSPYNSPFIPSGHSPDIYWIGREYIDNFALPNFYFHVVTAYSILRHNGVDVGKMDFLGEVTLR